MFKKLSIYRQFAALLVLFICNSCGPISIQAGSTSSPDDPRPAGFPVAQAQFFSQNGAAVSGSALFFFVGGGNYTLRLEGLSVPSETGLQVKILAQPFGQIGQFSLRATSGNQNYSISTPQGVSFKNVIIYSTLNNQNYASAQF